ncbi:hypothetical protein C1645_837751 [Glomus cerebriforme]|uniref:TLDc domain-containing protein n=1 Tax=Glomus cerebriforme TaxID=658196 RepID=A0A397SEY0_9GLOM|nr:hypothetical protein C1645_837751 [Glomus cerebriforme]
MLNGYACPDFSFLRATIVVVKIANSEQIAGEYNNPLSWDTSDTYKFIKDSFIFSFTNKDNFKSAKVGYSNGNKFSIGYHSAYGPVFGGGSVLKKYGRDIPVNFIAEDYEVFQAVKKTEKDNNEESVDNDKKVKKIKL